MEHIYIYILQSESRQNVVQVCICFHLFYDNVMIVWYIRQINQPMCFRVVSLILMRGNVTIAYMPVRVYWKICVPFTASNHNEPLSGTILVYIFAYFSVNQSILHIPCTLHCDPSIIIGAQELLDKTKAADFINWLPDAGCKWILLRNYCFEIFLSVEALS